MAGKNNLWQNRIVAEGEKAANKFRFNPDNWRQHPVFQQKAIKDVLEEIGWVQRVIENRTTGNLIDGHARVEEALKKSKKTLVPYIEVELSEDEEKMILAILDPIGSLTYPHLEKLKNLVEGISFASDSLNGLVEQIAGQDVDLDEFFEKQEALEKTGGGGKFSITLEFDTEDEKAEVLEALSEIDENPKDAVRSLLQL